MLFRDNSSNLRLSPIFCGSFAGAILTSVSPSPSTISATRSAIIWCRPHVTLWGPMLVFTVIQCCNIWTQSKSLSFYVARRAMYRSATRNGLPFNCHQRRLAQTSSFSVVFQTMNFTLFRDNSPDYIELRVARKAITHHDDGGNKFSSQWFYYFGLQRCIPMVRRSHLRFDVYPQG